MKTLFIGCCIISLMFEGCDNQIILTNFNPPATPKGLYVIPGDGQIELFWMSNTENDLGGYNVYTSSNPNGLYQLLKSIKRNNYVDAGIKNGETYYYKISAYNIDGDESALTRELVYGIPRPEGFGIMLDNYRTSPDVSGYDFSTYTIVPYDDKYTDVFYEYSNGRAYLDVWNDSEIQDMGYTQSLDDIGESPTTGWSPTKDAQAIVGHTYVIRTWDYHYAKIRVRSITSSNIKFDWAYQLQTDVTLLKSGNIGERGVHSLGLGQCRDKRLFFK